MVFKNKILQLFQEHSRRIYVGCKNFVDLWYCLFTSMRIAMWVADCPIRLHYNGPDADNNNHHVIPNQQGRKNKEEIG